MSSNIVGSKRLIDEQIYMKPKYVPNALVSALVFIALFVSMYCAFISKELPDFAAYTTVLLFLLSFIISVAVTPRNFAVGFLTSLLPFVIAWRIGAMTGVLPVMIAGTAGIFGFIAQFLDCVRNDQIHDRADGWFGDLQWQMTLVRIYFGFNEVGHCTEKLFAGNSWFNRLVEVFAHYGVTSYTGGYVVFAGLCELSLAIGIGCGFMTRLAGIGGVIYILNANQYGGHFFNGYTWNARASGGLGNGGWEYIMLLVVFFGSFAISGGGKFSVDRWLIRRNLLPRFLLPLCISKAGREQYLSDR